MSFQMNIHSKLVVMVKGVTLLQFVAHVNMQVDLNISFRKGIISTLTVSEKNQDRACAHVGKNVHQTILLTVSYTSQDYLTQLTMV